MADEIYDDENEQELGPDGPNPDVGAEHEAEVTGGDKGKDTKGGDSGQSNKGGFFKKDDSDEDSSYKGKHRKKKEGGVGGWIGRHKGLVFGLGGLGAVVIPIALFIAFLLGALSLPNFASDMGDYEFAHLTRAIANSDDAVVSEKAAIDGSDDSRFSFIKQKWGQIQDKYNTWQSMMDLNLPSLLKFTIGPKVVQAIKSVDWSYTVEQKGLLRPVLTKVTVNGQVFELKQGGIATKFVPKLQLVRDASFARDVVPVLNKSMEGNGYGKVIRAAATKSLLSDLDVSLIGWASGYTGKTDEQADIQEARDVKGAVGDDTGSPAATGAVEDGVKAEQQATDDAVGNDAKLIAAERNGGVVPDAVSKVNKIISGAFNGVVNVVSPTYQVAVTACLIYDDSLVNNGDTIDAQNKHAERTGLHVLSAADQLKAGQADATQAGAEVRKIDGTAFGMAGDKTNNVYDVANGLGRVTTNDHQSESSPGGDFTIFDVLFHGAAGDFMNTVASKACPVFTNLGTAIGLGVASLGSCFITGGGTCLGEQAVKDGAKTITGRVLGRIVGKIATEKVAGKTTALGGIIQDGLGNLIKVGGTTAVLTYLAKSEVYSKSLAGNNGLQLGSDYANLADEGTNIFANQVAQQIYGGRPLTAAELAQSQAQDNAQMAAYNKSQSAFQRYLARSNPHSLVDKLAISLQGVFGMRFFGSLSRLSGRILNPTASIANMFSFWQQGKVSAAAASVDDNAYYYGNIQFGYSEEELNLINNDPSYQPLENAKILQDSGQLDAINSKYGECFTDTPGKLISQELVKRQEGTANVIPDQGLCSPDNLGDNSPDNMAYDGDSDSSHQRDLIFRYRLGVYMYPNVLINLKAQAAGPQAT